MGQMDALALAGQCFLGLLAFMALIGLVLVLVNFVGRRRGNRADAPRTHNAADDGKLIEQSTTKDKGE